MIAEGNKHKVERIGMVQENVKILREMMEGADAEMKKKM